MYIRLYDSINLESTFKLHRQLYSIYKFRLYRAYIYLLFPRIRIENRWNTVKLWFFGRSDISIIISKERNILLWDRSVFVCVCLCVCVCKIIKASKRSLFSVPPKVQLYLGSTLKAENIKEGDDVYFECKVRANPEHHKITWRHNVSPRHQHEWFPVLSAGMFNRGN